MLKVNLEINNLTTSRIDKKFLENVVKRVLKEEKSIRGKIEISLVFLGEGRMKRLNKQYRGKNKVTDILSFSFTQPLAGQGAGLKDKKFAEPSINMLRLGEIFICLPRAKKQAGKTGHSLKKELAVLLIHGVLHLLGYKHGKGMEGAQERIIKKLN